MDSFSLFAVLVIALHVVSGAAHLPGWERENDETRLSDFERQVVAGFEEYLSHIQEIEECTGGKEYKTCGTACPANCSEPFPHCTKECVAGCFCPEGLVDMDGECVKLNQCPGVCTLPPETGPCRAGFTRYYYNPETGRCETFTYGGCLGNGNNFERADECSRTCEGTVVPTPGHPTPGVPLPDHPTPGVPLPDHPTPDVPLPGHECPGVKEYRSCGTACPPTCEMTGPKPCPLICKQGCFCPLGLVELGDKCILPEQCPNRCEHKPVHGPCKGTIPKYFFNTTSKACEKFIYGGCLGTGNNFDSLQHCNAECIWADKGRTGEAVPPIGTQAPGEGPSLAEGQIWISDRCNSIRIKGHDARSGVFYGSYNRVQAFPRIAGVDFFVTGQENRGGNTVAFAISWNTGFYNLKAVSAYSGYLEYLATGDPVLRTTYLLTYEGGKTTIDSEDFYDAEIASIACPRVG